MARYPIGKQNFKSIIEGDYVYVDKTRFIITLIEGAGYYFLARPRRFGKSLFLSTLEYFFKGEKELFKGLDIYSYDWDWNSYPVIRIDLVAGNYQGEDNLLNKLTDILSDYEKTYHITPTAGQSESSRFERILREAYQQTGRKAVVLVDEYDKPLVDVLDNEEIFNLNREMLRGFYSVLKASEEYLQFVLLTGITKFGQVNVFSGLNNLYDISLQNKFSAICGITEEELRQNFKDGINGLATRYNTGFEKAIDLLKYNYDGYHFSGDCVDIYNPFSVLQALDDNQIGAYWAASGTPKILAESLLKNNFNLASLDGTKASGQRLMAINQDLNDPVAIFYQTGYLTIKNYDHQKNIYVLGYPNLEVEQAFFEYLLPSYSHRNAPESSAMIYDLAEALNGGDAEKAMQILSSFSSGLSYDTTPKPEKERHFQYLLYIICKLLIPFTDEVKVEERTSDGRIDLLIKTDRFVYILELKMDQTAEKALTQIYDKDYGRQFKLQDRRIYLIGMNFSSQKNRIDSWEIEEFF